MDEVPGGLESLIEQFTGEDLRDRVGQGRKGGGG